MRGAAVIAATALLLAGCGSPDPGPGTNIVAEEGLPPIPDVVPASGCAAGWSITLDRESFAAGDGGLPVSAERLAAFTASVVPAVRTAIDEACKAGEVDPLAASTMKTLVVTNDPDRDTPKFYADEREPTRTTLADAFVIRDFEIPSEMELRKGMQCLTTMSSPACQESIQ